MGKGLGKKCSGASNRPRIIHSVASEGQFHEEQEVNKSSDTVNGCLQTCNELGKCLKSELKEGSYFILQLLNTRTDYLAWEVGEFFSRCFEKCARARAVAQFRVLA